MKRKYLKIIVIIAVILVLLVAGFAYTIWNLTQKSEDITGKRQAIPQQSLSFDSVGHGNSDWNCWQGTNFDKKSAFTGIKKDWSKGLPILWQVSFLCQDENTATWSDPVVQGKMLIVPGRDEKNDLVFCLNSETGDLIWKNSYPAESNTNHGPGARATPSIDNDRIYTFGRNGDLVCWNLKNGNMLWHRKMVDIGGVEPDWGYSSSPLVYGNNVIVQVGGAALAVAYDKFTGNLIWKSGTGYGGYAPATVFKADSSILLFSGEALSSINNETGSIYWSVPWATQYYVNASLPISEGNIIFVTSGYGQGCMAVKVENKKATQLWQSKAIEGQHSDPVIVDGYVYGYSGVSSRNNGNLVCLRLSDGKEMWKTTEVGTGSFAYADGYLICFDIKGNLYLVETNPHKFVKVAEIKNAMPSVINPAWTAPIIANGKLYVRYLQHLICFDISG